MILLDTNVLSEMMRLAPNRAVLSWLGRLDRNQIKTSAISIAELRFGIESLPAGQRRMRLADRFEALVVDDLADAVLPFDHSAAEAYGVLAASLRRLGTPVGMADTMIAAIAHTHEAIIATRNVRHFSLTGVEVVDPFAPPV